MSSDTRPEDRNATQVFDAFPGGATLGQLEEFFGHLRDRGAPGDARPQVKVNDAGEVEGMVCVVERHPEINEIIDRNRR